MVTRVILGSHFHPANLEDSVGKVVLAEFTSIDDTLDVARKAAAVMSLKIKRRRDVGGQRTVAPAVASE